MKQPKGQLLHMPPRPASEDDPLSPKGVADVLRCHFRTALNLMREGEGIHISTNTAIRSYLLGNRRYSLRRDVTDFQNVRRRVA